MNQTDAHFAGWLLCPDRKKETCHYTKTHMIVLYRRYAGFGVKIAVWFRYSLDKQTVNGNSDAKVISAKNKMNESK